MESISYLGYSPPALTALVLTRIFRGHLNKIEQCLVKTFCNTLANVELFTEFFHRVNALYCTCVSVKYTEIVKLYLV